jgi:amino acid efflux transporter
VTIGSLGTLLGVAVTGVPVERTMLLVTGAFSIVYLVGTAAAIRLLPRHTWVWRGSVVAFVSSLALLSVTGRYLLPQLIVGIAAVVWLSRSRAAVPAAPDPV